jgi:hypothetical protein
MRQIADVLQGPVAWHCNMVPLFAKPRTTATQVGFSDGIRPTHKQQPPHPIQRFAAVCATQSRIFE